jgi:hypothetical protein
VSRFVIGLLKQERMDQGVVDDQRKTEGFDAAEQRSRYEEKERQAEKEGLQWLSPLPEAHCHCKRQGWLAPSL